MTDELRAGDPSSPATNGIADAEASASAISIRSGGNIAEISDDRDLSAAAKRFLIAELNRLVEENRQLKQFKDKYHDVDKKLAVLKETIKPVRTNQFLSSACLIGGSAGVAAAPNFISVNAYGWYVLVSASAMLLIAGIVARVEGLSIGVPGRQPGSSSK